MWKVLPKFALLKIGFLIFGIFLTTGLIWVGEGLPGVRVFFSGKKFSELLEITTPVLIVFATTVWLFASFVWKWIWSIPGLSGLLDRKVCPNLNGTWAGYIEAKYTDEQGDPMQIRKEVEMVIEATFLGFDISLRSVDGYQRSSVIQSDIFKDPRNGAFYLSYVFESIVDQPKPMDDSKFDGAGKLHVKFSKNGIELVGVYWTNRAWQRGMQTAGTISLSRRKK